MKILSKNLLAACLLTLFGTAVMAQQPMMQPQQKTVEVSDSELATFAEVMPQVNTVQSSTQQEMVQAVKDNNMEVQQFNQMAQAQQSPNKEMDATEEEMKNFQAALSEVQQLQQELTTKMQKVVTDAGLTMNRYQQIAMAVNQDQELQQKVRSMMQPAGEDADQK